MDAPLAHPHPLSFCLTSEAATGLGAFEGIDDPLHLLSDMDTYLCEAGRSSTHHALASPTSARIVFSNVCRAGSGKRSHFESTLISCARARGKDAAVDDAFRASAVAERHSEHSFRIAPPVPGNQVRFSSRSQQQPLTLPLLCIRPCLSFSLGRVSTSANNAAIDA
ncbi:uncharacterized protein PAN0_001d0084 [Moesziomyces antarcticus]|uniref:Uncharacterized protein n=1 Tax=Pseudozyma antarctica TaxID=84753 RepID=A0A5C3FDR0_PSEA2|nr:uncharacterized protein PAN0_001d0084 [Moesziomyces antarcticus]GAK61889.1 hypothetical protein PAN0_001d0084 [Moesziomyces antarcticus]SPO42410.1 uncharacterized protein PSANT_00093 [Moesziomyces antarcticus]